MELVTELVEIPHPNFTEIPRVVLVEEYPVVVHSSGISASSGVLTVFPDAAVPGADVAPVLPGLLEASRHFMRDGDGDGGGCRKVEGGCAAEENGE